MTGGVVLSRSGGTWDVNSHGWSGGPAQTARCLLPVVLLSARLLWGYQTLCTGWGVPRHGTTRPASRVTRLGAGILKHRKVNMSYWY